MSNPYATEGPCCAEFRRAHAHVTASIKTLHALGARDPRTLVMYYHNMSPAEKDVVAVGAGKQCPCHEAPNPVAFREFIARTKFANPRIDPFSDEGVAIAEAVNRKYGLAP